MALTRLLVGLVLLSLCNLAAAFQAAAPAVDAVDRADAPDETRLQSWISQASEGLDARAIQTLQRISKTERRLLALRAYLRAGSSLPERWTWSQEQISAYPSTAEGRMAAADIASVATAFAAANPGFSLQVKRQPRSLDLQLAHWNENASVGKAAAALAASLERTFPKEAAMVSSVALHAALVQWKPTVAVPLAAPGLSPHGQGRAFDFQIEHAGRIVAGLDFAAAEQQWDATGWTQKLHAAVHAAGDHFVGPLAWPYEPWHYAYSSTAGAEQSRDGPAHASSTS